MIIMMNGEGKIEGSHAEVMSEATLILRELYNACKEKFGEDFAREELVKIGRLAVASDEEIMKEAMDKLEEMMKESDL